MTKTILITGTSSGLGRATAKLFQAHGWNVIATMRSPQKEAELNNLENVLVTRLDVQDSASIQGAVTAGIARFGRVDVLVNNAGYGAYGPLGAASEESIGRQFDVNVLGLLATRKALIPYFRNNRAGCIVSISSISGRLAFPLEALYHGTKFAIEGISEALYTLSHGRIARTGPARPDFLHHRDGQPRQDRRLGLAPALYQSAGRIDTTLRLVHFEQDGVEPEMRDDPSLAACGGRDRILGTHQWGSTLRDCARLRRATSVPKSSIFADAAFKRRGHCTSFSPSTCRSNSTAAVGPADRVSRLDAGYEFLASDW